MRRSILRLALLAAAAALVAAPHSSVSQAPPDELAARSLLATNLANSIMNPAKAEDYEFFLTAGGVPNILFLLDTSKSMERLPPNGPAFYGMNGGTFPAMPPGVLLSSVTKANVDAARAARTIVGCGLDAVSSANPAFTGNAVVQHIQRRRYYSPCGKTQRSGLVGEAYAGHPGLTPGGADYAYEASVCPYYTASNSQAVWPANRGGFDPDFYRENPNSAQVSSTLWVKDLVYHDTAQTPDAYARANNDAGHNFGKGWAGTSPPSGYPAKNASNAYASIDQFCDEQGTTALANGQVPAAVCKQCLKEAGWYYDGIILDDVQDSTNVVRQYPSLWYTGNYLSFFPPKFLVMRKIVKDVIATQSKVRMATAEFGNAGWSLLRDFNPTCAHPDSNFDSNRGAYVTDLNSIAFDNDTKPLATSLFDVGRYYHSPALPWFGAPQWDNGSESSSNSNDYAICYSCQTSSVILLTDGIPDLNEGNALPPLPSTLADASAKYGGDPTTGIRGVTAPDCPGCFDPTFTGTADYKNNLTRVAWYLHNFDLRENAEDTKDCRKNGGKQTLDTYTVGYSTRALAEANTILARAASEGGGLFVEAENPALLRQGLRSIMEDINGRSTSFSVATVSTLQTASGHAVIIPRFEPRNSPFWEGHLYRYELWSEFVNECDPNKAAALQPQCCKPNGAWDLDCDGQCRSAFLTDAGDFPDHSNPTFVQEGDDGFFYRNSPGNKASCSQAPMCVALGKACGKIPAAPTLGTPWWDAGAQLKKKKWQERRVFTVVDQDAGGGRDGRIDGKDRTIRLDSSTDASARAILPYLGNAENRVCNTIANRIETAGDPDTAGAIRASEVECAQAVVRWILGGDVFNEGKRKPTDAEPWPPPRPNLALPASATNRPDQERLPDRPFKLGDVFHSSPVDVVPPLPRGGIFCSIGHPQCLTALWRAPSGEAKSDDDAEYDAYVEHYKNRRKVVLVGSNAGLLHAFNGGAFHAGKNDEFTTGVDEGEPPFDGYFDRGYPTNDPSGKSNPADPAKIWAEELWAFLPPDMISKLALVFEGEHQLFVDGSAMVRDVWVDGTSNGMEAAAITWDDAKQAREYHTVAIVGERRGGTHYFALDITDATKLVADGGFEFPKFLWMWPQPNDRRSLATGETYTDFLPVPPPVGPVRIKATTTKEKTPVFEAKVGSTVTPTPFHERWIAFVSGGFDQQYVRGRGVHMLDVWTGHSYWDFAYPDSSAAAAPDDLRLHLRYPIPATVGMVMWGPDSRRENGLNYANAGFFDTATFGDTGGQLWTLRFHVPGALDGSGKVTNWFGARAFHMGGMVSHTLGWAHPFFYITANTALPGEYIYRAYIGTGDRFNLLDKGGGVCGPGNIRACAMRGCIVSLELPSNFVATPELGKLSGSHWEIGKGTLTSQSTLAGGGATIDTKAKIVVAGCPSPEAAGMPTSFTKEVSVTCEPDGAGRWGCERGLDPKFGEDLSLSNVANVPGARNWYLSVRIFDDRPKPRIPFATAAEAKAYDDARLWIRDDGTIPTQIGGFSIMSAKAQNPASAADAFSPGWAIYYDHGPTTTVDGKTYNVFAADERTSSISGLFGIVTWNTTQPIASDATAVPNSCFRSKCVGAGDEPRLAYHYAAHPLTGKSVLQNESGATIRSRVSASYVPAQGDQATVFVNQKGQVLVGMTVVNPNKGARAVSTGEPTDAVKDLGWIEIPEPVHACRHATVRPAAGVCK